MLVCACVGVAASIFIPLIMEAVVDGPIRSGDRAALLPMFFAALGLGIAEAGFIFLRRWIQSVAVLKIEQNIRDDLYAHLQRLPQSFHDRWQTGQLLSRAVTDLSTIRRFFGFGAIFLVVNALQYLAVIALLIAMYLPLGLIVALGTLPVLVLSRRFGRSYARISRGVQDKQGDLATLVEESATGIRVVKAFGRGELLTAQFLGEAGRLRELSMRRVYLRGNFWALLELVPNLTMALVIMVGAYGVATGRLSVGALVAFTALLVLLQWPVIDLGWTLSSAQEAGTAAERVLEVFDSVRMIRDRPGATPLVKPRGRLEFDDVRFRYPGGSDDVLRGISVCIEPGETLAVVGATGAGKSTITALPSRLYDVTSGRILLDGRDVRDCTLTSLRAAVAAAFEEPVLFSMSVRENLTLGCPGASEREIEAALELAQADFVGDLPWGLETRIGEQGLALSGGQRQRLALARAVLGKPAVLVLDDPLSALDVHTESLVEEALRRVLRETTALLVVHRPSTVALADRVALLQDGRFAAIGTHHELMRLPEYARLLTLTATAGSR